MNVVLVLINIYFILRGQCELVDQFNTFSGLEGSLIDGVPAVSFFAEETKELRFAFANVSGSTMKWHSSAVASASAAGHALVAWPKPKTPVQLVAREVPMLVFVDGQSKLRIALSTTPLSIIASDSAISLDWKFIEVITNSAAEPSVVLPVAGVCAAVIPSLDPVSLFISFRNPNDGLIYFTRSTTDLVADQMVVGFDLPLNYPGVVAADDEGCSIAVRQDGAAGLTYINNQTMTPDLIYWPAESTILTDAALYPPPFPLNLISASMVRLFLPTDVQRVSLFFQGNMSDSTFPHLIGTRADLLDLNGRWDVDPLPPSAVGFAAAGSPFPVQGDTWLGVFHYSSNGRLLWTYSFDNQWNTLWIKSEIGAPPGRLDRGLWGTVFMSRPMAVYIDDVFRTIHSIGSDDPLGSSRGSWHTDFSSQFPATNSPTPASIGPMPSPAPTFTPTLGITNYQTVSSTITSLLTDSSSQSVLLDTETNDSGEKTTPVQLQQQPPPGPAGPSSVAQFPIEAVAIVAGAVVIIVCLIVGVVLATKLRTRRPPATAPLSRVSSTPLATSPGNGRSRSNSRRRSRSNSRHSSGGGQRSRRASKSSSKQHTTTKFLASDYGSVGTGDLRRPPPANGPEYAAVFSVPSDSINNDYESPSSTLDGDTTGYGAGSAYGQMNQYGDLSLGPPTTVFAKTYDGIHDTMMM